MGSYVALGDPSGSVRLDVRLQDAAAGETVAALAETGTEDRLFDLASSAGAALRAKLGAGSVTATEAAAAQAGLPSGPEAARLYAQGLESLRRFEFVQAKDEMERLVALSPGSPLAHAALADAWSSMGYMDNARAEARKAFDLSKGLPRAERLSIEGRYREANAEWDKAAEIYRSLWTFYPDNLDYGLRLAFAQTDGRRRQGGLAHPRRASETARFRGPGPPDRPGGGQGGRCPLGLSGFARRLATGRGPGEAGRRPPGGRPGTRGRGQCVTEPGRDGKGLRVPGRGALHLQDPR